MGHSFYFKEGGGDEEVYHRSTQVVLVKQSIKHRFAKSIDGDTRKREGDDFNV